MPTAEYEPVPLAEGEAAPSTPGRLRWSLVALGLVGLTAVAATTTTSAPPAAASLDPESLAAAVLTPEDVKQRPDASSVDYVGCIDPTLAPVMGGYDLVSYFSMGTGPGDGMMGSSMFSTTYEGYTFYFKDQINLNAFAAAPTTYLPEYGGFCAWGVASEAQWTATTLGPSANPSVWKLINGKLYFFMYDEPMDRFLGTASDYSDAQSADAPEGYIMDAHTKWKQWFGDALVLNTGCFWANATSDQGAQPKAAARAVSFKATHAGQKR